MSMEFVVLVAGVVAVSIVFYRFRWNPQYTFFAGLALLIVAFSLSLIFGNTLGLIASVGELLTMTGSGRVQVLMAFIYSLLIVGFITWIISTVKR